MLRRSTILALCERAFREELGDALERFAFSRLHEENALQNMGRYREAENIAFWRRGVRDAADLVRIWELGKTGDRYRS